MHSNNSTEFQVIHTYSRKQAIDDGYLIDITDMAREAGITFPVAITQTLWTRYIEFPEALLDAGQSLEGRLWDCLCVMRHAAAKAEGPVVNFSVLFLMINLKHKEVPLKAVCGPGDNAEPTITIMLPEED